MGLGQSKTVKYKRADGYEVTVSKDKVVATKTNKDGSSETITLSTDGLSANHVFEVVYKDKYSREIRKETYKEDLKFNVKGEITHLGSKRMRKGKKNRKISINPKGQLTRLEEHLGGKKWRKYKRNSKGQLVDDNDKTIESSDVKCLESEYVGGKLKTFRSILSEGKSKWDEANKPKDEDASTQDDGPIQFGLSPEKLAKYREATKELYETVCSDAPRFAEEGVSEDDFFFRGRIGLALGAEGDFFAFTYTAAVGYDDEVAEGIRFGGELGYTHYVGKETDFGKVDGVGFVPIKARATIDLSEYLNLDGLSASGGLGYAFGTTEGIDGGINYDIGIGYRIKEANLKSACQWDLTFDYDSINIQNGAFNSVAFGIRVSK
ncbi:hypothetical protein BST99_05875 [Aureicoccus marinus]|uniref:Uncharacterized protein n=2 Tax=Aureicoccus marinus TaxID=754435 RepID=A0A2S7T729_9FLAO|nr:hypothetical protein BST99_05875 [Aureicoccus marinus]